MILPLPKVTVEEIGSQGVAEAAEVDPLALVFLPEGNPLGGLFSGRRILSAVLFIACVSNGFCLRTGSLGLAPLAMKWLTSNGSGAGLGGLPTGKGEGGGPSNRFVGMEAPLVFCRISPKRLLKYSSRETTVVPVAIREIRGGFLGS